MYDAVIITLGAINTLIAGGAAAYVYVQNARYKNQSAAKAQEFTEQGQIIDRQEKHIARLDEQVHKQQKALDRVNGRLSRSLSREAKMQVFISVLLDALHKKGIDMDVPPDLLKMDDDEDDADFEARSNEQNTLLLKAESAKLKEGRHEDSDNRG